jgi:uncharacterized membrane-anchored protein YhcB (DUF1043 family)
MAKMLVCSVVALVAVAAVSAVTVQIRDRQMLSGRHLQQELGNPTDQVNLFRRQMERETAQTIEMN